MNAKRQGYRVTDEGKDVVRHMLTAMTLSERMDFGNARGMRTRWKSWCRLRQIDSRSARAKYAGDARRGHRGGRENRARREEEQKQADSENVAQLAEKGEQE